MLRVSDVIQLGLPEWRNVVCVMQISESFRSFYEPYLSLYVHLNKTRQKDSYIMVFIVHGLHSVT